jgi:16S rRNA (cytosine1402-N4)-methyltransferase
VQAPVHEPVLAAEMLRRLGPVTSGLVVDCTVGLGGHASRILAAAGASVRLLGLDLDESALRHAAEVLRAFGDRVRLVRANFADLPEVMRQFGEAEAAAILADLGVNSWQLERPETGLSFQVDGPLDMRLSPEAGTLTAADLLARCSEGELAGMFREFGEQRLGRRVAMKVVAARGREGIRTTSQLSRLVLSVLPAAMRKGRWRIHPATKIFMALRIAVNREMENLERFLASAPPLLAVGGRLAAISFHSLEDRRVKQAFRHWSKDGPFEVLTPKPVGADEYERRHNPRSRSAKLRLLGRVGTA